MSSGDSLLGLVPVMAEFPSANYPGRSTRNVASILLFDDTVDQTCEFPAILDRKYSGGGITATICWAAATAIVGDVKWTLAFKSFTDDVDDLDVKAFATAQSVIATCASGAGEFKYSEIAFTDGAQIDSIAIGENFRLQLQRNASDTGNDDMSGNAQFVSLELRET